MRSEGLVDNLQPHPTAPWIFGPDHRPKRAPELKHLKATIEIAPHEDGEKLPTPAESLS